MNPALRTLLTTALISACLLCLIHPSDAAASHWTYHGNQGPAHWGELGNTLCAGGANQSTVNIDRQHLSASRVDAGSLRLHYLLSPMLALNNGHSVQVTPLSHMGLTYQGTPYRLQQFHFHTPSEHQFEGREYPMEMHLVHQADDGRLLVIGLMIETGEENTALARLFEALPKLEGKDMRLDVLKAPNLKTLLPTHGHHLFYNGSLTTPPCSEGVQWVLYEQPIQLSARQIKRFRRLFPDNHRPARELAGRDVGED